MEKILEYCRLPKKRKEIREEGLCKFRLYKKMRSPIKGAMLMVMHISQLVIPLGRQAGHHEKITTIARPQR